MIARAIFCLLLSLIAISAYSQTPDSLLSACPQIDSLPAGTESANVTLKRNGKELKKITVGTLPFANKLMRILRSLNDIEYDYVLDGCSSRAFLGAKHLYDKFRVHLSRINIENAKPSLSFSTDKTFEGFVEFWTGTHSSLLVCVLEAPGEVRPYVLDPTFFEQAQIYEEWVLGLRDGETGSQDVFLSSMYNLDQYAARDEKSFSIEDSSCATNRMEAFTGELKRLKRRYDRWPFASRNDDSGEDNRDIFEAACFGP